MDCAETQHMSQANQWLLALLTFFREPSEEKTVVSPAVQKARLYLEDHLMETMSLEALASYVEYSKNQLIRLFQKELNCTPMRYYLQRKIAYAKSQLIYSNASVCEISDMLGFCDDSYFSKVFKEYVGCSPGQFRAQTRTVLEKSDDRFL